jgi:hypothetical protein
MSFEVGQLVVCVDGSGFEPRDAPFPSRGAIYAIRGTDMCWQDGTPVVYLEEIIRPPDPANAEINFPGGETGFYARRFRPVRPTSIEIFRRATERMPEGADA